MLSRELSSSSRNSIQESQVTLLYQNARFAIFISTILALLIYFLIQQITTEKEKLLIWISAVLFISALRLVMVLLFKSEGDHRFKDFWRIGFVVLTGIAGTAWSSVLFIYDVDWPPAYQLILWLTIPGKVSGGMSSLAYYYPAFVAYAMPMLVCTVVVLVSMEGEMQSYFLPIAILYFAMQFVTAKRYNQALQDSIVTRIELLQTNALLQKVATEDALTGIANRRAFEQQLDVAWRRCIRNKSPVSLLLVDVDHFKQINDQMGHQVGDYCLREVASEISRQVARSDDMVARWGGEEFAVLLPETDLAGAMNIAENVRQAFGNIQIKGVKKITTSVGVASCIPKLHQLPTLLVSAADEAVYAAKAAGRNCVQSAQVMNI